MARHLISGENFQFLFFLVIVVGIVAEDEVKRATASFNCSLYIDEAVEKATDAYIAKSETNMDLWQEAELAAEGFSSLVQECAYHALREDETFISKRGFMILKTLKYLAELGNVEVTDLYAMDGIEDCLRNKLGEFCGCVDPICDPNAKYRTADGSCNNLDNSVWGRSFTPQRRDLSPKYDDGLESPRTKATLGGSLPSPRKISNTVHKFTGKKVEGLFTALLMQWGQFLDHDVVLTPTEIGPKNTPILCCNTTVQREECFSIEIPPDDKYFKTSCMNFVRSVTAVDGCKPGPRLVLNKLSSYIDASNVYGSTLEEQLSLRLGTGGKLKMRGNYLPENPKPPEEVCEIRQDSAHYCLFAGDARVQETPALASMHTLWAREHNRIVDELAKLNPVESNPDWTDEILFQEARKIVAAQIQHITYNEFLPVVLGQAAMEEYGLSVQPCGFASVYNNSVDASITTAFSTASYRFGHSIIVTHMGMMDEDYKSHMLDALQKNFFKPYMYFDETGYGPDMLLRHIMTENCPALNGELGDETRNQLFIDKENNSFDLASLNIQRGRDHGLPAYNDWRDFCGLTRATTFLVKPGGLVDHSPETAAKLSTAYKHVDDIDLWTGAISEEARPSEDGYGILGPTMTCLVALQFKKLKIGDRFYYENEFPTGFTEEQLNEIKKVVFSNVVCQNTNSDGLPVDSFKRPCRDFNPVERCEKIPGIDLAYWSETNKPAPKPCPQ